MFCQQLWMYICIGYILPTIVEYCSVGGCLCALQAQGWGIYMFWDIYLYWICFANNFGVLFVWGLYICIGYILPTIVECCSVRGCQCALRAQGWGLNMIWDVYLYWIYSANNCGVFSVRRCQCAVRAQGWGLNMIWDMYLYDLTIYYKDGDTAKNSINMVKFTPLHRALLQRDHRQGAGLTRELHCPSWAGARLSWRGGWSLPSRQLRCAAQGLRPAS